MIRPIPLIESDSAMAFRPPQIAYREPTIAVAMQTMAIAQNFALW